MALKDEQSARYDSFAKEVEAKGGVVTCDMGVLREIHGAGKLGIHVVASISEQLDQRGLSHYPKEQLPINQWEKARIFKRGTPVGDVIRAATTLDDRSDEILRAGFGGSKANDVLRQVRDLVCDL